MVTGRSGGWDDQDDTELTLAGMTAQRGRRQLLGAVAGGLTLAASGLLLPGWLVEETEAANDPVGAIQRRAGKRRQRRHRRVDRQRRGEERKNENDAPQGRRSKEITFIAHNDRARGVMIQVFVDEASVGTNWVSRPEFWLAAGAEKELAYHSNHIGFSVTWDSGRGTFISAIDPFVGPPAVTIRHRGENGPKLMEEDFPLVNGIRTFEHRANRAPETWTVWRVNDTANSIVFDVRFKILDSTP